MSVALLLLAIGVSAAFLLHSSLQEKPIPLSQVAASISAGQVIRVEDSPLTGLMIVHYRDGSEHKTQRDKAASFLEQMRYLGVTNTQLSKLRYEISDTGAFTA